MVYNFYALHLSVNNFPQYEHNKYTAIEHHNISSQTKSIMNETINHKLLLCVCGAWASFVVYDNMYFFMLCLLCHHHVTMRLHFA